LNLLLDTHAWLWFAMGDRRLSRAARAAMEAEGATLHVSAASVWEMAIKASLRHLTLPDTVHAYVREKVDEGYRVLPITWAEPAAVERLPFHHPDPFDRLLVAHAMTEGWPLVTRDRIFRRYGIKVIW
jgi:PIN domain nuclease of toxin-antitoxin system